MFELEKRGNMKLLFRIILIALILIELVVIVYSFKAIYELSILRKRVLGEATIVPIRKENLIISSSSRLKYFYEPPPSVIQTDNPGWLPNAVKYTINNDTLNERFNYSVKKPPAVFRIITLGDSYTFGHYINTKDNWTEQLEDMLNKNCVTSAIHHYEIINLGESGYDVAYAAHRLSTRGMKYKPDLIIYFESGFGFSRIRELSEPLITKFKKAYSFNDIQNTEEQYIDSLVWKQAEKEIHEKYSAVQIFEEIHKSWRELLLSRNQTKVLISTFNSINLMDSAKLKLWTMGYSNVSIFSGVRDIFKSNAALQDGHPSVKGHTIIANDTYEYLTTKDVIKCSSIFN